MVLGKLPVPGRPTSLITVGQGPIALAVGTGGVVWIFLLSSVLSPLSPSLWETARYRLKYCLKGPLNPKQPTINWGSGWLSLSLFCEVQSSSFWVPSFMSVQCCLRDSEIHFSGCIFITMHLIPLMWIYTNCQCPFYRTLCIDKRGLEKTGPVVIKAVHAQLD